MINADRIFQKEDGSWSYRLRGNNEAGPFNSYSDAEASLAKVVRGYTREPKAPRSSAWPRTWRPGRLFRRSATRQT